MRLEECNCCVLGLGRYAALGQRVVDTSAESLVLGLGVEAGNLDAAGDSAVPVSRMLGGIVESGGSDGTRNREQENRGDASGDHVVLVEEKEKERKTMSCYSRLSETLFMLSSEHVSSPSSVIS